jgi:MinD superfamily P-loop ATPase
MLDGNNTRDIIIDSPPGVSCPAVNAVMDSDAIVLVTEPTPFGLYDLSLAHQAFEAMGRPMGVVVNRSDIGNKEIYDYCRDNRLEILAQIPYSREIAEAYSRGEIISETSEAHRKLFQDLARRLIEMANRSKMIPEELNG